MSSLKPTYSRFRSNARPASNAARSILFALAIFAAGAIAMLLQRPGNAAESAADDLAYVWELSSKLSIASPSAPDNRSWLLRYDADGLRSGEALQVAGGLGLHLADGEEAAADSGTLRYEGSVRIEAAFEQKAAGIEQAQESDANGDPNVYADLSLTISKSETAGQGISDQAIILVKPSVGIGAEGLRKLAERVEAALFAQGGQYTYSFRVNGTGLQEEAGSEEGASLGDLFSDIAEQAKAKPVDIYEDEAGLTISETRMSPFISAAIATNGSSANLQLSAHRDSETGMIDWVIGVPVITGDYSTAN